ncbi:hypothetical protein [Pedobacter arcticus]|uniref:hypothetical protein n=1 Tax=Pedobacter arcticus TaxID=752140 RepID=UPI0012B6048F|nr:hypothetical protein [Pedobacter arcticus]
MNKIIIKIKSFIILLRFSLNRREKTEVNDFSFIVFSKDRPMQLDALLKSLFHYTKGNFKIHVVYAVTDKEYAKGYKQVKKEFLGLPVSFIMEKSFKKDLNTIVGNIQIGRVFFLVDDIIFKAPLNLEELKGVNSNKEIFSLRHSLFLNYSYVVNKTQKLPDFLSGTKDLVWKWEKGELDWNYPLSVDGHLFNLSDVKFWVKWLDYRSPNTFEHALQLFKKHYDGYLGKSYRHSVVFNNPCNKVQSDINNIHGNVHQLELLNKWFEGYRIDFLSYEGLENRSVHEERELKLLTK